MTKILYVVTNRPSDYPDFEYVARKWIDNVPTGEAVLVIDDKMLGMLRQRFSQLGFVVQPRHEKDDPVIVETWVIDA